MKWSEMKPIQQSARVAEHILGWQWIPYNFRDVSGPGSEEQLWLLPDGQSVASLTSGEWTHYQENEKGNITGKKYLPYWIPHYSTSMDAAWLVVEKLGHVDLCYQAADPLPCEVSVISENDQHYSSAYARTMPEAICIVALRSIGIEVE